MSTPIYLLAIGNHNIASNLAIKAIPEGEVKEKWDQQSASLKDVGATSILFCNSAWADEEHPWWTIERFPSVEARIEHVQTLQKIGWLDLVDAFTLLGTSETEPEAVTVPNPIYQLWLVKASPAGFQMFESYPKGVEALIWEKHDAVHKENNSQNMLVCNSYWCNEAYPYFGVSVYPNVEAHMRISESLAGLGWHRYMNSYTLYGISA